MTPLPTIVLAMSACMAPIAAAPTPSPFWWPKGELVPTNLKTTNTLAGLQVTLSNGTTDLPVVPAGMKLKAMAVGVGTQNYTCNPTLSAPAATGASATLINGADLLPYLPSGSGPTVMDALPPFLYAIGRPTVDASVLPKAGLHYFSAPKVPTFDLTHINLGMFYAAALANVTAPATSTQGANGAVAWLALKQNPDRPTNKDIQMVYRVLTAAGAAPKTCDGQPSDIYMPYAAQYFFYG